MRVLHYIDSLRLEKGGIVRAVIDIAQSLGQVGVSVTIATHDITDAPDWVDSDGCQPELILLNADDNKFGRFGKGLAEAIELVRQHDIVHLHNTWSLASSQWAKICRQNSTPYVISTHGFLDEWSMRQKRLKKRIYLAVFGRSLLEQAGAVHFTAQGELIQSMPLCPKANGRVAPLPLDISLFGELPERSVATKFESAYEEGRPIVLFLSRICAKKRPDKLIEAARLWKRAGCDAILVIAGGPDEVAYLDELRFQAKDLGDTVRFPGFARGETKVAAYAHASLFVLPTMQENFGYVFYEALAAGVPVVTTRGADTWVELENSGGACILESTATADEFAKVIIELLSDSTRLKTLGQSGRSWVLNHFQSNHAAESMVSIYEEVLEKQRCDSQQV